MKDHRLAPHGFAPHDLTSRRTAARRACAAQNRTAESRDARRGTEAIEGQAIALRTERSFSGSTPRWWVRSTFALLVCCAMGTSCAGDPEPPPPAPLTTDEQAELEEVARLIHLYRTKDPTWTSERDAAIVDPRIAELLVQNFIRALLRAHKRENGGTAMVGSWSDYHQHQAQLIAMQEVSIPLLIVGLRDGDKMVVALVKDTLLKIGAPAVVPLRERFEISPDVWERREILAVLSGIGGPDMIPVLSGFLNDGAWQVRGEAYLALGRIAAGLSTSNAKRDEVLELLRRGLADSDRFVRCQAIKGLAELGDDASITTLIERFRRAVPMRLEVEEQRELLHALRRATRLPAAVNVEEFEAWLVERKSRP